MIVCYVDDIMGTASDPELFQRLIGGLENELNIVVLGEITGCLGMVVTRYQDGSILLNNEIYMDNMVEEFGMHDCGFVDTPGPANSVLSIKDCIPKEEIDPAVQHRYRSLIGTLLYPAICWRPDIAHRVCQLARFSGVAGPKHVAEANRLVKYCKKTRNHGLFFCGGLKNHPIRPMFINSCDAGFAADEDKVSITGYCRQMVDANQWQARVLRPDNLDLLPSYNCVAFCSRRQKSNIAQSSFEAEYITSSDATKMIKGSSQKWESLGFEVIKPEELYVDASSIIDVANDWKVSERTRHVDIRYHNTRSAIVRGEIILKKIDTSTNVSDMFTKCLDQKTFEKHRDKLMIGEVHPEYVPHVRTRISRYDPEKLPERKLRKKQIALLRKKKE